jgi:hypothetical protein
MGFQRSRGAFLPVLALTAFAASAGCGNGKPSVDTSLTEATVSGVVSVKGTPATGGQVRFNPSNSERIVPTRSAEIGSDGRYSIKTLTGDNRVTFDGEVAAKNKGVGLMKEYASVKSGENQIDFDLMGAGAKVGAFDLAKKAAMKNR